MSKRKKRELNQLKAWAELARKNSLLVGIAGSAPSPTQAYELAYIETGNAELAKSCYRLASIKRDYGRKIYNGFVLSGSPKRLRNSTGKEKGAIPMSPKVKPEKGQPKTWSMHLEA